MSHKIHIVRLGFDQAYIIQSDGVIAVDAGEPGKGRVFERALLKADILPADLNLLVITHGYWDHIGSAREIRDLTGAPIAMHECEAHWLEESLKPLSPGVNSWGRMITKMNRMFMPLVNIPAADVDIRLGNEDFPLYEYGVPGTVVHTPGHSFGSVSILLDSGEAFVGDMAMNRFPLRFTPGFPIFAVDEDKVRESWRRLLERGARTVYPAHGKPFPAKVMERLLKSSRY